MKNWHIEQLYDSEQVNQQGLVLQANVWSSFDDGSACRIVRSPFTRNPGCRLFTQQQHGTLCPTIKRSVESNDLLAFIADLAGRKFQGIVGVYIFSGQLAFFRRQACRGQEACTYIPRCADARSIIQNEIEEQETQPQTPPKEP